MYLLTCWLANIILILVGTTGGQKPKPITAVAATSANNSPPRFACSSDGDSAKKLIVEETRQITKLFQFILPTPRVVSLLAQLMVVSSQRDFPIKTKESTSFEYISNPESFRATLQQISNEGWEAFRSAHDNMFEIQSRMLEIPKMVNEAIFIITTMTQSEVKDNVPSSINQIKRAADKSVELAKRTLDKFNRTNNLINEVLVKTQAKKGMDVREKVQQKLEKEFREADERRAKEELEEYQQRRIASEKEVKEFQASYKSALDNMPTHWEVFGQKLIGVILHGALQAGMAYINPVGTVGDSLLKSLQQPGSGSPNQPQQQPQQADKTGPSDSAICASIEAYNTVLDIFGNEIRSRGLFKESSKTSNISSEVSSVLRLFKTATTAFTDSASKRLSMSSSLLKGDVGTIVDKSGSILNDLQLMADSKKDISAAVGQELNKKLQDLEGFIKRCLLSINPKIGDPASETTSGSQTAQMTKEQFNAQMELRQLEKAKQMAHQYAESETKTKNKLSEIAKDIRRLNFTFISLEETIAVLKKGLGELSKLQEHWRELVEFFKLIAIRATLLVDTGITNFVDKMSPVVEKAKLASGDSADMKMAPSSGQLALIMCQEQDINRKADILFKLCSTYYLVSSEQIMPQIRGLGMLLNIDDPIKRENMVLSIQANETITAENVEKLIEKQIEDLEKLIDGSIELAKKRVTME